MTRLRIASAWQANDESRINNETRMTNDSSCAPLQFVIFSFLRHSTFELRHLQQVSQFRLFCFEIFFVMRVGLGSDRNLLDHFETVPLQADNFLRIICQEAKLPHAEIEKDLRAQAVIAQVARISKFGVRLHGVEAFLL